jgi:hypothetical protein
MKVAGLALQAWCRYQSYILAWFLVILGACSLPALYSTQVGPVPFKAVMMIQAVTIIGLGFALNPDWQSRPCRLSILVWSFFLALASALVTVSVNYENGLLMVLSLKAAAAVFLLSFFMHSVTRAVMAQFTYNRHIPWNILCAVIMLTTLPLWMAPWVELIAATPPRLHLLLWSSPLSYLAGMLDYDYLRNQWFYEHTPYGMLRYEYPDKISYSVGLIGMSLLLLGIKTNANLENNNSENL